MRYPVRESVYEESWQMGAGVGWGLGWDAAGQFTEVQSKRMLPLQTEILDVNPFTVIYLVIELIELS